MAANFTKEATGSEFRGLRVLLEGLIMLTAGKIVFFFLVGRLKYEWE